MAKKDPDILSIHMSSGLSGTINSALAAVKMVPEANITIVDTKTLSAAAGWQVWAAVKGTEIGVVEGQDPGENKRDCCGHFKLLHIK